MDNFTLVIRRSRRDKSGCRRLSPTLCDFRFDPKIVVAYIGGEGDLFRSISYKGKQHKKLRNEALEILYEHIPLSVYLNIESSSTACYKSIA